MTFEQIVDAIKNLGVPVGLLAYIIWRGDNFFKHLIKKLDRFNGELSNLAISIQDLTHYIKNFIKK